MTGDNSYSRRQILGAATGVGALGLTSGAATGAYFSDRGDFPGNEFRTGMLRLDLAGATAMNAEYVDGFPSDTDFESGDTLSVAFPDLEPGESGVFTAAYRLCENPGTVRLRTRLEGSDDTADPDLAEFLEVQLVTRPDCDSETGGGHAPQHGRRFVGTLGEFHELFSDGGSLDCRYAGKIENEDGSMDVGDQFELSPEEGPPVTIELTSVERNDDEEVVGFDYDVLEGPGICQVTVAGGPNPGSDNKGPNRAYYTSDCAVDGSGLTTAENEQNPSDELPEISHVEFYVCGDCRDCAPGCLDLVWAFDDEPPEELEDDSLSLDLEFHATQCRHQGNAEGTQ